MIANASKGDRTMSEYFGKAADAIDRIGGRLAYRLVGIVAALAALIAAGLAWSALSAGQTAGGLVAMAFAAGMALLTRFCFSPARRLSDME